MLTELKHVDAMLAPFSGLLQRKMQSSPWRLPQKIKPFGCRRNQIWTFKAGNSIDLHLVAVPQGDSFSGGRFGLASRGFLAMFLPVQTLSGDGPDSDPSRRGVFGLLVFFGQL